MKKKVLFPIMAAVLALALAVPMAVAAPVEAEMSIVSNTDVMVTAGNVSSATYPHNAVEAWEPFLADPNPPEPNNSYWDENVDYDFSLLGADWIWESYRVVHPADGDVVEFQRTFTIPGPPTRGEIRITCDNGYEAYLNDNLVASGQVGAGWGPGKLTESYVSNSDWESVEVEDVTSYLRSGVNVLKIIAANEYMNADDPPNKTAGTEYTNPAGLIFELELAYVALGPPVTTQVEVVGGAGGSPPVIKAKWEKFSHYLDSGAKRPDRDMYTLDYMTYDDDETVDGIQVFPPGQDDPQGEIDVEYWAVVTDPQGLDDIVFVSADVHHPDGSPKYEVMLLQVFADYNDPIVKEQAFAEMEAADAAGAITYNDGYTLDDLEFQYEQNEAWIFKGVEWLDYHQPHGMYTVNVCAADQGLKKDYKENAFEYVKEASIAIDFTVLDFGQVLLCKEVPISGDNDMATPDKPTVKNLGNCDAHINVHFDDMGLGWRTENGEQVPNVTYDARLDLFDPVPVIKPCEDTLLPGKLLMCETMKISFSIHVDKAEPGTYNGTVTLCCEPVP